MSAALASISRHLLTGAVGYLLGTIPSADVVARRTGRDVRGAGSGNPGAANVASVIGPTAGLVVLVADISKGAAAGRLGARIAGVSGADLAATAAVVGHCYPVWSGFHGGKGVATSVGQVLSTLPAYFPIDAAVAVATSALPWWKQRAFAATMVSSAVWVGSATMWWRRGLATGWGAAAGPTLPLAAAASSVVIARRFLDARAPAPIEEALIEETS